MSILISSGRLDHTHHIHTYSQGQDLFSSSSAPRCTLTCSCKPAPVPPSNICTLTGLYVICLPLNTMSYHQRHAYAAGHAAVGVCAGGAPDHPTVPLALQQRGALLGIQAAALEAAPPARPCRFAALSTFASHLPQPLTLLLTAPVCAHRCISPLLTLVPPVVVCQLLDIVCVSVDPGVSSCVCRAWLCVAWLAWREAGSALPPGGAAAETAALRGWVPRPVAVLPPHACVRGGVAAAGVVAWRSWGRCHGGCSSLRGGILPACP
jgi:hypothetical protein